MEFRKLTKSVAYLEMLLQTASLFLTAWGQHENSEQFTVIVDTRCSLLTWTVIIFYVSSQCDLSVTSYDSCQSFSTLSIICGVFHHEFEIFVTDASVTISVNLSTILITFVLYVSVRIPRFWGVSYTSVIETLKEKATPRNHTLVNYQSHHCLDHGYLKFYPLRG